MMSTTKKNHISLTSDVDGEYFSETLGTLLQTMMRTIGCKDGFLFKYCPEDEENEFQICTCILTSADMSSMTNKDGTLQNVHKNAKWLRKMMKNDSPSFYNNACELIPNNHSPLINFAIIPLHRSKLEKLSEEISVDKELSAVALLGNRDDPFRDIRDLDATKQWINVITSVLSLHSERQSLLQERGENLSQQESRQILETAKRVMLETKAISEAKDTFLATMSHEIRTPLNGIIGMTTILEETDIDEDQSDYLETIRHCSVQLMEIITDILDYSKMAANALNLDSNEFEVCQFMEEAHDVVLFHAEEKNLTLTYAIDPLVPSMLVGDAKRIKQILVNLLTNAVKFTENGGVNTHIYWTPASFTEEKKTSNGILNFKIIDTGIGIPKKDHSRIFETFVQLDNNISRQHNGTGLGLGIVCKLLDLMKGTYTLKSKCEEDGHVDTGTKIHIKIPLRTVSTFKKEESSFDIADEEFMKKISEKAVLIFDTDVNNRIAICGCFLKWNMRPYACTSYQEIKMYLQNKEFSFFAIFIDMDTPESNKVISTISGFGNGEIPLIKIVTINGNKSGHTNKRRLFKPIKCRKVKYILLSILDGSFPKQSPKLSDIARTDSKLVSESWYLFKVLVAEDNRDNRKVISKFLSMIDPSIKLSMTNNGKQAVEMACNEKFQLILMDIKMPVMDGFEATRRIRTSLGNECPYIVAVTATVFENDRKKCTEGGMDAYISKPINFRELKTLVNIIKDSHFSENSSKKQNACEKKNSNILAALV